MNQCMARTGKTCSGKRCTRKGGKGHKGHFCKVHAELYEKGSNPNVFHSSGWYVYHTYTFKFPGLHPVAIRRYKASLINYNDRCAKLIQRAWRRCVSNPEYRVCKERLMREFGEI